MALTAFLSDLTLRRDPGQRVDQLRAPGSTFMLMNCKHVGFDPASLCSKSPLHSAYSRVDGSLKVYFLPTLGSRRLPAKRSRKA